MTRLALAALLLGAAMPHAIAASGAASLCGAGETPLFTCPVGHKLISICEAGGKAIYDFGRPGKVEMSSRSLFTAEHGFSGGGETQISFKNNAYTYTVYNRTIRTSFSADGPNDPNFTAGLLVQKDGKTVSTLACGSDATISTKATHLIPPGQYIEH